MRNTICILLLVGLAACATTAATTPATEPALTKAQLVYADLAACVAGNPETIAAKQAAITCLAGVVASDSAICKAQEGVVLAFTADEAACLVKLEAAKLP